MESLWSATCILPERNPLQEDIKVDVAVIGAGMAGLLIAYLLQQAGVHVVVLEANTIASGVTKNTTAKITSQHRLIYDKLIQQLGEEKAAQYARANQAALEKYREVIEQTGIACNFEEKPAYVYSQLPGDRQKLEDEVKAAQALGIDARFEEKSSLPFPICGAVKFPRQAQFHPLRFLEGISRNLTIYEHSMVKEIADKRLFTPSGTVTAGAVVIASHFPFINSPGHYFMRLHQERSYVIALEQAAQLDGMYLDCAENGYSFRNYENLLLLGGAGHRTGQNTKGGAYTLLRQAARSFFPDCVERYHWSAQDCIPADDIPYIGEYASDWPGFYVATGFKKWGMTGSMVAAMLLTDAICGKRNENSEVFSPQRFSLGASAKGMLKDSSIAATNLLKQKLMVPDTILADLPKGHGGIVEYKGIKVGVYKNDVGNIYMVSTKCPHLGCQLAWNPDELTWECPCHGSRFDFKGRLLMGPAQHNLDEM